MQFTVKKKAILSEHIFKELFIFIILQGHRFFLYFYIEGKTNFDDAAFQLFLKADRGKARE